MDSINQVKLLKPYQKGRVDHLLERLMEQVAITEGPTTLAQHHIRIAPDVNDTIQEIKQYKQL